MLPLMLQVQGRHIVVAGRGHAAQQRYEFARGAGADRLSLFVIDQDGWACHVEAALYERLPVKADLEGAAVVFVAGLGEDTGGANDTKRPRPLELAIRGCRKARSDRPGPVSH